MLAWEMEVLERCPVCHTRHDEWAEDRNAYYVDEWRCLGCEKIEYSKDAWREEGNARGIYMRLVKPDENPRGNIITVKR